MMTCPFLLQIANINYSPLLLPFSLSRGSFAGSHTCDYFCLLPSTDFLILIQDKEYAKTSLGIICKTKNKQNLLPRNPRQR